MKGISGLHGGARRVPWTVIPLLVLALSGCGRPGAEARADDPAPLNGAAPVQSHRPAAHSRRPAEQTGAVRDLSIDESMGGHTLVRHVGKTDAELGERLRREPQISAASTYVDRAAAERAVGAALAAAGTRLDAWGARSGRRPNLVLHYAARSHEPLGRSLARGQQLSAPCDRALVVLRWDERRDRFYVLTSYPEAGR